MKTTLSITELNELVNNKTIASALKIEAGKHYGWALGKVNFIPSTQAQAKAQVKKVKNGDYDNLLMCGEWISLESFLNENGFTGEYQLTKSGSMCRLINIGDYLQAIKKAFSL